MLSRRLVLALLAPTALVSLALVGACIFGVLYLNHLHLNLAADLSENRQSHQAAVSLETVTRELLDVLHADPKDPELFPKEVEAKARQQRQLFANVEDLANLTEEKEFAAQIEKGLTDFDSAWNAWKAAKPEEVRSSDNRLAHLVEDRVLKPCIGLRKFNMAQEEASDRNNSKIVGTLKWVLLLVGLGAPVGGLLLGFAVARGLHHSICQLSVRIRDAAGRLTRDLGSVTLQEDGDLTALHGQLQQVTEEIERVVGQLQDREREILHAEQLAAVGQVAAGVAHELRNPLTSVKMLVQTGLEGTQGLPSADLSIIEQEVRRMERFIQTFLDFARPPRCERQATDLAVVIGRALTLVEGRARKQRVTLKSDIALEGVCLDIDPEQIQQVIVNLLLNALDALPGGGTIQLTAKVLEEMPAPGCVEIRIRDSGIGIGPAIEARLFEPFVSSKETGLGLGLSICKRLVEAHGGSIQGRTAREGGAVFTIRLPLEMAPGPGMDSTLGNESVTAGHAEITGH